MELNDILNNEIRGSIDFFLDFTNLDKSSPGYGLTADSTQKPGVASIAASGSTLTAWVIAVEHGYLTREKALEITRGTLRTLLESAPHHRGFFAHFLDMQTAQRSKKCEYSTIDTALCLNGVITAMAYFNDAEVSDLGQQLLDRVDWNYLVFEKDDRILFRMAYNPDRGGDYVTGEPGFIYHWSMAAEQKMMYLQAATRLDPGLARRLYQGFSRDTCDFHGQQIIVNPGGTLFVYLFSEAWMDFGRYLDPDGIDWFNNTRLAALANREFCIQQSARYRTYHANSWGSSAGDSPWGYDVSGFEPCMVKPHHNGTVSIYTALATLPFTPEITPGMIEYLYANHPQTWGKYGFYDAYNLDVNPPWYSHSIYGIDKGCSMIMIENYRSRLIWDIYTNSPIIQKALDVLGFKEREGEQNEQV